MTESSPPESTWLAAAASANARRGLSLVSVVQGLILALLTANLIRIPVLSRGESEAPILLNDVAVGVLVSIGFAVAAITRSFKIDRVALIGLAFAAIGGASALLAVHTFGLSTFELTV